MIYKKKVIRLLVICLVCMGCTFIVMQDVEAASKLNESNIHLTKGEKFQLRIQGNTENAYWTSSNTKIVKVSQSGKVSAIGKGKCKIICTVGKKKLICKVTIRDYNSELVSGKWKQGDDYASLYTLSFCKDGKVKLVGYRNKDLGNYKYIGHNKIKAVFDQNYWDEPGEGYVKIKDYKYSVVIDTDFSSNRIYCDFDQQFEKQAYSNCCEGWFDER